MIFPAENKYIVSGVSSTLFFLLLQRTTTGNGVGVGGGGGEGRGVVPVLMTHQVLCPPADSQVTAAHSLGCSRLPLLLAGIVPVYFCIFHSCPPRDFFFFFFFYTLLSHWEFLPLGNSGRFPQGKPAATESHYPTLTNNSSACWFFSGEYRAGGT